MPPRGTRCTLLHGRVDATAPELPEAWTCTPGHSLWVGDTPRIPRPEVKSQELTGVSRRGRRLDGRPLRAWPRPRNPEGIPTCEVSG
ncbi:hypothetical protein A176_002865 [Myxococcus hansupus]|uniref:Uncharacterized protein n=1 Tax=Pseudomyxococcus hansupus TaxID=1297742 RepID=A0A0H4WWG5_9BACT|nr:hypothetical protein A176_002865 [Myxococcus hansupus]